MFKVFFDIFTGFLASAVFGGIVITSWLLTLERSFGEAMLAVLAWIIVSTFLFGWLAKRRLNKLGNLLEECKVEEYVEAYDKLEKRGLSSDGRHLIRMNRDRGLMMYGAVDEAIEDLEDIYIPEKHKPKEMHQMALLNIILFEAYVEKGELDKAIKALSVCKYMTQDKLYREPYLSRMFELCRRADMRLALAQGEFDGLEEKYWEVLRHSEGKLDKVIFHYRLAEIAEHYGNEEDRREHLEYVVDNGGTCIYKYFAQKALEGEPVKDGVFYTAPEDDSADVDKQTN